MLAGRWPAPSKTYAELLHGTLLGLWGMPIGELWDCGCVTFLQRCC